jgi:hypothetical protein
MIRREYRRAGKARPQAYSSDTAMSTRFPQYVSIDPISRIRPVVSESQCPSLYEDSDGNVITLVMVAHNRANKYW